MHSTRIKKSSSPKRKRKALRRVKPRKGTLPLLLGLSALVLLLIIFAPGLELKPFSRGMGGLGLPGDHSSQSRFVRAAFVKQKSPADISGEAAINHFFHILNSVAMPKGCVITPSGEYEYTRYSCCIDCEKGDYFYTTYDSGTRVKYSLRDYDLSGSEIYICR